MSYLLQRIETYPGLVILASNFKSNIDEAFQRRFQSMIYFPMPKPEERQRLWEQGFPTAVQIAPDIDWQEVSERYELTGANIMNVVQHCCISALEAKTETISLENLRSGIQRELVKEGKLV